MVGLEIKWRSQTGTRTEDNRDYGGVGLRGDEALCVVLDGSTKGPDGGALARGITCALIDWYVATDEEITAATLTARLRGIHEAISREHSRDSASYMIVHVRSREAVLVLHAGDCLLGLAAEKIGIVWQSQPHTLANVTGSLPVAEIAGLVARHRLTRSFRAREFLPPDAIEMKVTDGSLLLIATDGFWAELSALDQNRFIGGQDIPMPPEGDDRSLLSIRRVDGKPHNIAHDPEAEVANLYVKRA